MSAGTLLLTSPPTYWRCEPGWSWRARPLTDHLLWYVMDGVGHMTLNGQKWDLAQGSAVVFGPGDEPVAGHDPRRRLLVFGMHFGQFSQEPGASWRAGPQIIRDRSFLGALAARADAAYRRGGELGGRQAVLCLEQILCLLQEETMVGGPSPADLVIDGIAGQVRQDPGQPWTVPALARLAGLSTAQFTRRFRARTGLAPGSFIVRSRIDRAGQLLAETGLTIAQIATELGYAEAAFFSRQFRQYTGKPPTALRATTPAGDSSPSEQGLAH